MIIYVIMVLVLAIVAFVIVVNLREIARMNRDFHAWIKHHPDEAYDYFLTYPKRWRVFIGNIAVADLKYSPEFKDASLWKKLPLKRFEVPKLGNRTVTVYEMSKDAAVSLMTFLEERMPRQQADHEKPKQVDSRSQPPVGGGGIPPPQP